MFMTPSIEPRVPETDGENERPAPEPETPDAVLDANAEPVPCPMVWPGPFRAVPREPVAAWAMDCPEAPAMLRPDSAHAPLLITPDTEARALEAVGENEPLAPEPETADTVLAACAEPLTCPEAWLGLFRAVPRAPVAAWASDCVDAPAMPWPDSARAALLRTRVAAAREAEAWGENELLALAALTELGAVALRAEVFAREKDASDALGVLRAALRPEADCAVDCAEAMRMLWLGSA